MEKLLEPVGILGNTGRSGLILLDARLSVYPGTTVLIMMALWTTGSGAFCRFLKGGFTGWEHFRNIAHFAIIYDICHYT
jgi:hypothetical protein